MDKVSKEDKKRIMKFVEKRLNEGKSLVIFSYSNLVVAGDELHIPGSIVYGLDKLRNTVPLLYDAVKHGLEFIESPEYNKEEKEDKDND